MGQQKRFFESENIEQQQGRGQARSGQSKNKHFGFTPSMFVNERPENLPLSELLKLILLRLRRSWVSFRFQAEKKTRGALRPKAAFQIILLAGVAYYVFAPDAEPTERPSTSVVKPIHYLDDDQPDYLEVGHVEEPGKPYRAPKTSNEAAPVSEEQLLKEQALAYIQRYHTTAIGEMRKFGIPASISLAQGLIESRAGTSKLAKSNNNHFGMKCFSKNCKKGHCTNFTDDTHKDFFRKFKTPWESWRAHSELLASGRYAKLKKHGKDYRAWAYGLKSAGYASDRTYAEKLIGIIERYQLYKYDK
jgi:flagellum-specific peptidoglycan hydrolase FlgJ